MNGLGTRSSVALRQDENPGASIPIGPRRCQLSPKQRADAVALVPFRLDHDASAAKRVFRRKVNVLHHRPCKVLLHANGASRAFDDVPVASHRSLDEVEHCVFEDPTATAAAQLLVPSHFDALHGFADVALELDAGLLRFGELLLLRLRVVVEALGQRGVNDG